MKCSAGPFVWWLSFWMLNACSGKSETGNPGVCSLSCSNAILGSNDPQFQVKSVLSQVNFQCKKDLQEVEDLDAILVQFQFTEKATFNNIERLRPVPFLAFEPLVTGVLSEFKNPENINPLTGEVPQRYVGIRTPKSEWCSDACGVASIEIEPRCLTSGLTNEIKVVVHSGPLYAAAPATVTIVTPGPDN